MLYRLIPFAIAAGVFAQEPAPQAAPASTPTAARPGERTGSRAPLFFRETWKTVKGEHAATQDQVASANLELKLYGPSANDVQAVGNADDPSNPPHVWTGLCASPVAVALRDKDNYVDLTGLARVRWETKVSGFHKVRPVVKLADGTWLVGDREDGSMLDWHDSEFSFGEVRWLKLKIDKVVTTGNFVKDPDLSKVDEVGFADLLPSSGHGPGGWSDLAWIEVYGKSVKRDAATTSK
ncbi:MAG: hypothetical protein ACLPWF_17110 [Bryobacteraceae bacterium]